MARKSKYACLAEMGREWAWLAVRYQCEPTTTGNLIHDRACAEEFLKLTGKPPAWYSRGSHGPIAHPDRPQSTWEGK